MWRKGKENEHGNEEKQRGNDWARLPNQRKREELQEGKEREWAELGEERVRTDQSEEEEMRGNERGVGRPDSLVATRPAFLLKFNGFFVQIPAFFNLPSSPNLVTTFPTPNSS